MPGRQSHVNGRSPLYALYATGARTAAGPDLYTRCPVCTRHPLERERVADLADGSGVVVHVAGCIDALMNGTPR